jgi:hypothetical protein
MWDFCVCALDQPPGPPLRGTRGKTFQGSPYGVPMGEMVFYNILHFITYYPTLTQLGFISAVVGIWTAIFSSFQSLGEDHGEVTRGWTKHDGNQKENINLGKRRWSSRKHEYRTRVSKQSLWQLSRKRCNRCWPLRLTVLLLRVWNAFGTRTQC